MSDRKNRGRKSQRRQREAGRSPVLLIGLLLVAMAIIAAVYLLKGEPAEGDSRSKSPTPSTTTPAPSAATPTPPVARAESPDTSSKREGPIREDPLPVASEALERLVGSWLRPDGGYILEIRGFDGDGDMDAAYFNPRPIHVSEARAGGSPEDLRIFIELTDVGYPGATYDLRYIAEQDVLAGFYFQPTAGQKFDVFFIRRK